MTVRLSTAARSAAADAVVDLVDGGSGAGYIEIRTGSKPTNPDTAASGTLLATLPMSDPAFGGASSGVATADTITPDEDAAATGTAEWFRMYDSNDSAILDGDVTETSGGGDIELSTTSITTGDTVTVTALTVTMPLQSA